MNAEPKEVCFTCFQIFTDFCGVTFQCVPFFQTLGAVTSHRPLCLKINHISPRKTKRGCFIQFSPIETTPIFPFMLSRPSAPLLLHVQPQTADSGYSFPILPDRSVCALSEGKSTRNRPFPRPLNTSNTLLPCPYSRRNAPLLPLGKELSLRRRRTAVPTFDNPRRPYRPELSTRLPRPVRRIRPGVHIPNISCRPICWYTAYGRYTVRAVLLSFSFPLLLPCRFRSNPSRKLLPLHLLPFPSVRPALPLQSRSRSSLRLSVRSQLHSVLFLPFCCCFSFAYGRRQIKITC